MAFPASLTLGIDTSKPKDDLGQSPYDIQLIQGLLGQGREAFGKIERKYLAEEDKVGKEQVVASIHPAGHALSLQTSVYYVMTPRSAAFPRCLLLKGILFSGDPAVYITISALLLPNSGTGEPSRFSF